MIRNRSLPVCLLSIFLFGCGAEQAPPELTQVAGSVTLDGEPAKGVTVMFVPQQGTSGYGAWGVTDDQGWFTLEHFSHEQGVQNGTYRITFSKFEMPDGSAVSPDIQPESVGAVQVMPEKFLTADTSGQEAVVTDDKYTFEFNLTTN